MLERKVLIIDDEVDLCQLLKNFFVRKGYEVTVAHKLAEGIPLIETWQPDHLFLDHNLPDGTGWDLVPKLQQDYPKLRFFLISAFNPVLPEVKDETQIHKLVKPLSYRQLDPYFN